MFSREFVVSTVVILVIFLGTLLGIPPFSSMLVLGEYIKESWEKPRIAAPAPHSELFSIRKISEILKINTDKVIKLLKMKGIKVDSPDDMLKDVAIRNNMKPSDVYELLLSNFGVNVKRTDFKERRGNMMSNGVSADNKFAPGSGIGMRCLKEICKEYDLVLIDTSAGLNKEVINFIAASNKTIVITTPEPTALADAYALIKKLYIDFNYKNFELIFNMVKDSKEFNESFNKFTFVCQKYLKFVPNFLGHLPFTLRLRECVKKRQLITDIYPNEQFSLKLKQIAAKILNIKLETGKSSFWDKFVKIFKLNRGERNE
jgi:hypothetical protein